MPVLTGEVGLLYLYGLHDERDRGVHLNTHAAYLEAMLIGAYNDGPLEITLHAGLGLGGVGLDYTRHYDDTAHAAFEMRSVIGVSLYEHVELRAGGAFFTWGVPGDTSAYGGLGTIGLGLRLP